MRRESLDFAAEMPSARFHENEKPYFFIKARGAETLGELCRIIQDLGSGIVWGVPLPCQRLPTRSSAILSAVRPILAGGVTIQLYRLV
jgi:hypothetical protein